MIGFRLGWTPALLLLSIATPQPAIGQAVPDVEAPRTTDGRDLPVIEHLLENGMRFLLLPRAGAPTVSFVVRIPVGSVNESLGRTGISHFLEHLLFKGTTTIGTRDVASERELFDRMDAAHDSLKRELARRPAPSASEVARLEGRIGALEDSARVFVVQNEYSQIFQRNGGRGLNATTDYEATHYFVDLPSNRVKLWFVMEGDRVRNPVFREFFTERDVIAEERRARVDTSPSGLMHEAHMAAAFQVHPYGVPPSGYMDDIRSLSRSEVEDYFRRYYGPNNATVAIVGDFDADSARVWADEYFGPIPPGAPPPAVLVSEPPQRGERRVEILYDAEPQLRIGWKVPGSLSAEGPALGMLANLLVAGRDSRLYRTLVRDDRLATAVSAGTGPGSLYPGLFTIYAAPRDPHTPAEVEAAIYAEIDRLRTEPPTEEELERVRTRLEAAEVRRLTSNQGLAFQLVSSQASWGDWRETFSFQERMRAVEPTDIMELLERHFRPDQRTVAVLRRGEGP